MPTESKMMTVKSCTDLKRIEYSDHDLHLHPEYIEIKRYIQEKLSATFHKEYEIHSKPSKLNTYQEQLSVGSAEDLNAPPTSGVYIGKKEDDIWSQDIESNTDAKDTEPIYDQLVKNMGVLRRQNSLVFNRQHRGLMHLKPRYKNVKDEVLRNTYLHPLSTDTWNQTLRKSSAMFRRWTATYVGNFESQLSGECNRWTMGEDKSADEIVTLKLYTDFDKLQRELKKCFRFDSNADDRPSEDRLRQFYHWRLKISTWNQTLRKSAALDNFDFDPLQFHLKNCFRWDSDSNFAGDEAHNQSRVSVRRLRELLHWRSKLFAAATKFGRQIPTETMFPFYGPLSIDNVDFPEASVNVLGDDAGRCTKPPWDTCMTARSAYFAIHLFREQMFSMSDHLEYHLKAFLHQIPPIDHDDDEVEELKQNHVIHNHSNDTHRKARILRILWAKFATFKKMRNHDVIVKIDNISDRLKPYFLDQWFPDAEGIHFLNEYSNSFRWDSNFTSDEAHNQSRVFVRRLRELLHWRSKLLATVADMILNPAETMSLFYGPPSITSSMHIAGTFATVKGKVFQPMSVRLLLLIILMDAYVFIIWYPI